MEKDNEWLLVEAQLNEEVLNFDELKDARFKTLMLNGALKQVINMVPADKTIAKK